MGVFNTVIAMVSADVLVQLNRLGCTEHEVFMQWLQETGVTSTHIGEDVFQLTGRWEVVSRARNMLNKLPTLHKAENMEELCNWLKSTETATESDMDLKNLLKAMTSTGTQTDYLSGMAVTEDIVQAIQEGIRNAAQAATVQSSTTAAVVGGAPNFAPQINIYTGDKKPQRKSRGRPRGRPPTKAKLKEQPVFPSIAENIRVVKREPESDDDENALEEEEEDVSEVEASPDEDYQPPKPKKRKTTVTPRKVKVKPEASTANADADETYREKMISHVSEEDDTDRAARIEAFVMVVEPGTKDFDDGHKFGCNVCEFKGRVRERIREHVQRIHLPAADYSCTICGKKYNVKRDLKRHIRNHELKHVCDICGRRYRDRRNLEMHMKKHQESYNPKPFSCDECHQSFCNQYVLKRHINIIHRGIKEEHVCVECGKIFTQKHSLQEHSALHLETRPHVCDVCGAAFTYKSSLRSHRRTQHTQPDERKFICEVCSKGFKTRQSLETHKVIHNTDKRIPCPMCGKLFTQSSAVTRHMVTHTGEKNHKCTICGQGFNDPSILRRHYSGVHKVEVPRKKAGRPVPLGNTPATQPSKLTLREQSASTLKANSELGSSFGSKLPPLISAPKDHDSTFGQSQARSSSEIQSPSASLSETSRPPTNTPSSSESNTSQSLPQHYPHAHAQPGMQTYHQQSPGLGLGNSSRNFYQ